MGTFIFTDNRGIHKHVITLDDAGLAAHLAKDPQFLYYWRKGWDPVLAANRSIYTNPPSLKAPVCPEIIGEQWVAIENELMIIMGRQGAGQVQEVATRPPAPLF